MPAALPQAMEEGADQCHVVNGQFEVITADQEAAAMESMNLLSSSSGGSPGDLILHKIPASYTGTGISEWIEYMLPSGYDPEDPTGHPLMVCWHGYGQSCVSVSSGSEVDEECEERNWIYLSFTGSQQCHFGYLTAQVHCTRAVQYLIEEFGFNVDLSRIYTAGLSMGSGASASYASRHLYSDEGYTIAGSILISGVFDWVHAYNMGDAGVKYWLPILLGGAPMLFPFKYKQISTMTLKNGTYSLSESMGRNLAHGQALWITYAGNDPLKYGPYQNEIYVEMLNHLGADVVVDYYATHPEPHSWELLDIDAAFDFLESHSLDSLDTETVEFLADRTSRFFWTEVEQTVLNEFSEVKASVYTGTNALDVERANNAHLLGVDCAWTGLHTGTDLTVDYASGSSDFQDLELLSFGTSPTYIVDKNGILHPDYSYDSVEEKVRIGFAPYSNVELKVSLEPYNLALTANSTAVIGQVYDIDLSGGDPYDTFLYMFGLAQMETQVGLRHILISPIPLTTYFHLDLLDGAGEYSMNINVPYIGSLVGMTVHQQFLTYDPMVKDVSNLVSTLIQN